MKRARPSLIVFLAALLFASSGAGSADEGVAIAPLKPLHRVCGVVFDQTGERFPGVSVSVLEGEKEIAVQKTGTDGKFSFDSLRPGKYELRISVENYAAATWVTLVRPNSKSKKEIAVSFSLSQGGKSTGFSLVDTKRFEARLNPTKSE